MKTKNIAATLRLQSPRFVGAVLCALIASAPAHAAFMQNSDGLVVMEAENGTISGASNAWAVEANSSASSGSLLGAQSNSWDPINSGVSSYDFTVDSPVDALIYLRKRGDGNSVWVSVDGETISGSSSDGAIHTLDDGWVWSSGFGATRVALSQGQHTLQISNRDADLQIDKIIIAPADSQHSLDGSSEVGPSETSVSQTRSLSVTSGPNTVSDFSRFPGETNYSEAVTLAACDANAVRINKASDLRLLETSNASVFCIAPGDYRSEGKKGSIVIRNKHGSASAPKIIQLDSSLDVNDVIFDLPRSQLAILPPLEFENSSHWLVDRMAFFDVGTPQQSGHIAIKMHASPNIVLNRLRMEGNYGSVNFYHGSHNSVLQNSLLGHSANVFPDNTCVSLMGGLRFVGSESIYNTPSNGASEIFNVGLYNNEFVNCNDGIHFLWDPREGSRESYIYDNPTYWSDYQGAKILGNDLYIDSRLRTDCYGNPSSSGICANAENAIDIKAGSKNPTNPVLIKDNRMWGFRKADGHNLSDHGAAISLHFIPAKNIEVTENIIWDAGAGIAMTRGVSDITVHNNVIHGMFNDGGRRPIYGNTGASITAGGTEAYYGRSSNVEISYNNIIDSGGHWGLVDAVRNTTLNCNVVVSTAAASSWFNSSTSPNSRIGKNSYYGGVRGSGLEPSGSTIRSSASDAKMAQACFTVGVASKSGGTRKCLAGVLNTSSSPHACSSDIWQN